MRQMNDPARPTTRHERDRALERLQSITTGTAIAATIASAAFGTLAAFTWSGDTTDAATNGATIDGGTVGATVAQVDDTPIGGGFFGPSTESSSTTATATPLQPTTTPLTASKKKSRVSSGGSR